jgi:hypothetical protein
MDSVKTSWVLHAIKNTLGYEPIRQDILLHYFPTLHRGNITKIRKAGYKNHVVTFDAFIEPGKTREDKSEKIKKYLSEIVKMNGVVVFTAANIQQDASDFETHYQTFIVDNDNKQVYAIDPANDIRVVKTARSKKILVSGQGIYYAEVAHQTVKPFFEENTDYQFKMVPLSHPAQIIEDDVFCQSWSLYILITLLTNRAYLTTAQIYIPESQLDKYDTILGFYKRLVREVPAFSEQLNNEYIGEVKRCMGCNKKELLKVNPEKWLLRMTKEDMEDTD